MATQAYPSRRSTKSAAANETTVKATKPADSSAICRGSPSPIVANRITSTCQVIGFTIRESPERRWQRIQRIEHRAGKQEHEVEDRRHRVERIVAPDRQGENGVKEEPARGANDDSRRKQRQPSGRSGTPSKAAARRIVTNA